MSKKAEKKVECLRKIHQYEEIFTIVEENDQFRIAVGNKIVDQKVFKTLKDAQKYIDEKPWKLMINVTCLVYEMSKIANNQ